MNILLVLPGLILLVVVLLDAFQTIILPRRPAGGLRITRLFFVYTWQPWRWLASRLRPRWRDNLLSFYGPLSVLLLFFLWALLLAFGFGFIFYGLRVPFRDAMTGAHASSWERLCSCLYVSGTTIFTLGLGDVLPQAYVTRLLIVVEAGTGLGFIALVIGYVPVLYTSFSQREVLVALLDGRAGSPPTASELLLRYGYEDGSAALNLLLESWELWCAEVLESHISFPILCFYRSQHDNQNWLAAITAILDTCAVLIVTQDHRETRQAELTFALGRHLLADLVHVFQQEQVEQQLRSAPPTRLSAEEYKRLCQVLVEVAPVPSAGLQSEETMHRLGQLRQLYEPLVCTLAGYLHFSVTHWITPVEETRSKADLWSTMKELRRPGKQDALPHVSQQSTAARLDAHEQEGKR